MGGEVEVFDLRRMFLGDEPIWFLAEIVFRTVFMFVYTLVLVRITGKRGLGELSPFELLMVVALGSAVGDPMFYADVPLVHAMAVVTAIVLLQRGVAILVDHSEKAERFVESTSSRFVVDGVVDTKAMHAEHFARDELFMLLREEGVEHLGQVKRAYLEPSGRISVWLYPKEEVRPGLPLTPATDPDYPEPLDARASVSEETDLACCTCGAIRGAVPGEPLGACVACDNVTGWAHPAQSVRGETGGNGGTSRRSRRGILGR